MLKEDCNDFNFLALHSQREVHGNPKEGRRPYIYYEGVIYRNDVLSNLPDLIGTKLNLIININDLRVIKAYLPDGSEFGYLTATGKWGVAPHSLQTRKQIKKLKSLKQIYYTSEDDPTIIYQKHLEENAIRHKNKRNYLAELNRYKVKMSNEENKKVTETKVEILKPDISLPNTDGKND